MATAGEDILDNEDMIDALTQTSKLINEIKKKQDSALDTKKGIDDARRDYLPVAIKTAGLYFTVQQLATIGPMYRYSLKYYLKLFESSIESALKDDDRS